MPENLQRKTKILVGQQKFRVYVSSSFIIVQLGYFIRIHNNEDFHFVSNLCTLTFVLIWFTPSLKQSKFDVSQSNFGLQNFLKGTLKGTIWDFDRPIRPLKNLLFGFMDKHACTNLHAYSAKCHKQRQSNKDKTWYFTQFNSVLLS